MGKVGSFVFVLSLVACGSDNKKKPDAPIADAAADARACGAQLTAAAPIYLSKNLASPDILWTSDLTGGTAGNTLLLAYEVYGGIETSLQGTFDLSTGNQANY